MSNGSDSQKSADRQAAERDIQKSAAADRLAAERAAASQPTPAKRPSEVSRDGRLHPETIHEDRDRHREVAPLGRQPQHVAAVTPDDDPTDASIRNGTLQIHLESADGPVLEVKVGADGKGRQFRYLVGGTRYAQSAVEPNSKGEKVWVYRSDLDAKR